MSPSAVHIGEYFTASQPLIRILPKASTAELPSSFVVESLLFPWILLPCIAALEASIKILVHKRF
jgi:hypothetical protein